MTYTAKLTAQKLKHTREKKKKEEKKNVENDDANDMALFGHLRARASQQRMANGKHTHIDTHTNILHSVPGCLGNFDRKSIYVLE